MPPGRRPIPTPIKLANGNPGKSPINAQEPQAKPSRLNVPKFLKGDKIAAAEYKRMGKLLLASAVMTELDETALAAYASTYSRWVTELNELAKEGTLLKSPKGNNYANPRLWVANSARDAMNRMLIEFGMTPSSRSRIKAIQSTPTGGKGTLERVLSGADQGAIVEAAKAWEPPQELPASKGNTA